MTPYLYKTTDFGVTWESITDENIKGWCYKMIEDIVNTGLLFLGTEQGLFVSIDGGEVWSQFKGDLPNVSVRDLVIQEDQNDLVVASFGRGFYVLDDYTPLRNLTPETFEAEATIFPVKTAKIFPVAGPIGFGKRGSQGASFYRADNPPYGAVVTYHLKEGLESLEKIRRKEEKEKVENDEPVYYPSWDDLREEDREVDPQLILTITDEAGDVVRRFTGPGGKGLHRVAWDLRHPYPGPIDIGGGRPGMWEPDRSGPMVMPGTYAVTISKRVRGEESVLAGPVSFDAELLGLNTTAHPDQAAAAAFRLEAAELYKAVQGAVRTYRDADNRLKHIRKAVEATPDLDTALLDEVDAAAAKLADLGVKLNGDRTVSSRSEPTTPSISARASGINWSLQDNTSGPTRTMRDNLALASRLFGPVLADLTTLVTEDIAALEAKLDEAGAPYTPGRIPVWSGD